MYNKFTREEMRIIEQTKKEGEELQKREKEEGKRSGGMLKSLLFFVLFFAALAFAVKIIIALAN